MMYSFWERSGCNNYECYDVLKIVKSDQTSREKACLAPLH